MRASILLFTLAFGAMFFEYSLTPATARQIVNFNGIAKGTILVKTQERRLYFGLGNGKAVRYRVGVGRAGKRWSGSTYIRSKRWKPAWKPTPEIARDNPRLPAVIPGGAPGNPVGIAALVLAKGKYAIHGTNRPSSVGKFVSYGCIRMYNRDMEDLYSRVRRRARVIVR